MRAMEEEAERMNPLEGSGATPSMGLSQIRGGRKRMTKEEVEANEDAKEQGKALSEHLHKLHGSGYARDFHAGMSMAGGLGTGRYEGEGKMEGGFWGTLASLAIPLIGNLLGKGKMTKDAHDELMALFKKHEKAEEAPKKMKGGMAARCVGAGKSGRIPPRELEVVNKEGMDGKGFLSDLGIPVVSNIAGMFGLGEEGKKPKKEKRVVGAGDGRRKRAEVVRKVMKEKGMKMIEASKYVKEHGLY